MPFASNNTTNDASLTIATTTTKLTKSNPRASLVRSGEMSPGATSPTGVIGSTDEGDASFPFSFDIKTSEPPRRQNSLRSSRTPSHYSAAEREANAKLQKPQRSRPTSLQHPTLHMSSASLAGHRTSQLYGDSVSLSRSPSARSNARRTSTDLNEAYRDSKGRMHDPEYRTFDVEMAPHIQLQRARDGRRTPSFASNRRSGMGLAATRRSSGLLTPATDFDAYGRSWNSSAPLNMDALNSSALALGEGDEEDLSVEEEYFDRENEYESDTSPLREGSQQTLSRSYLPTSLQNHSSFLANHSPFSYATPSRRYSKASDSGYGGTGTGTMSPSSPPEAPIEEGEESAEAQLLPPVAQEDFVGNPSARDIASPLAAREADAELDAFTGRGPADTPFNDPPTQTVTYDEAGMPVRTKVAPLSRTVSKRTSTSNRSGGSSSRPTMPLRELSRSTLYPRTAANRYFPSQLQTDKLPSLQPPEPSSPSSSSSGASRGGLGKKKGGRIKKTKKGAHRGSKLMGLAPDVADQLLREEDNPFKTVVVTPAPGVSLLQQAGQTRKLSKHPQRSTAPGAPHGRLGRSDEKARASENIYGVHSPHNILAQEDAIRNTVIGGRKDRASATATASAVGMVNQSSGSKVSSAARPDPVDELAAFTGGNNNVNGEKIITAANVRQRKKKRQSGDSEALALDEKIPMVVKSPVGVSSRQNSQLSAGGAYEKEEKNSRVNTRGSAVSGISDSAVNSGVGSGLGAAGPSGYIPSHHGRAKSMRPGVAIQEEYTPGCSDDVKRAWQSVTLSLRFGAFRTQRRITRKAKGLFG